MTASSNLLDADFSKFASDAVMKIVASNATIPVAIATSVGVVTIAGIIAAYKGFEAYEEKKHLEEITRINSLAKKYLQDIEVPQFRRVVAGFPLVYNLKNEKDVKSAECMHMTDDEIKSIGNVAPLNSDITLSYYQECIMNALKELKEYYFARKSKNDITSGVLCYLLFYIEKACLNFQGYDFDIEYLNRFDLFIDAYFSPSGETSQHFSHLSYVCSYLREAKQELEKHREARTLFDLLTDLRKASIDSAPTLIKKLTQLLIRKDYWKHIDTLKMEELAKGILRKEYIRVEILHQTVLAKDPLITTSELGYFEEWVKKLADYYVDALHTDTKLTAEDIFNPQKTFILPDVTHLNALNSMERWSQEDRVEAAKLKSEMQSIKSIFAANDNIVTLKYDKKKKKFVTVSEDNEVSNRALVIQSVADLIHKIISLQHLTTYMLKSIKELGEISFKNPRHFRRLFHVLYELCNRIKLETREIKDEILAIQKANDNHVRLENEETLTNETLDLLTTTNATIIKLSDRIKAYREKLKKNKSSNEQQKDVAKREVFAVMKLISDVYSITIKPDKKTKQNNKPPKRKISKKISVKNKPAEPKPATIAVATPSEPATPAPIVPVPVAEEPIHTTTPTVTDPSQQLATLNAVENEITATINSFHSDESEIKAYHHLHDQLLSMQSKATAMLNEQNKSDKRSEKAEKTLGLTLTICNQALAFLHLDNHARSEQAATFKQKLDAELTSKENSAFIDEHKNSASKFLYSICPFGIFRTDTRKHFASLSDTCDEIVKLSQKPN